jgi:hypothetical protein
MLKVTCVEPPAKALLSGTFDLGNFVPIIFLGIARLWEWGELEIK